MFLCFDANAWFAVYFVCFCHLFVAGIDDVESVLMRYAVERCLFEVRVARLVVKTGGMEAFSVLVHC